MKCNREYKPKLFCSRIEGHKGECVVAYSQIPQPDYKEQLRISRQEHRRLLDMVCEILCLDRAETNIIQIEREFNELVNSRKTARKTIPRGGPNPTLADAALARLGYPPRGK